MVGGKRGGRGGDNSRQTLNTGPLSQNHHHILPLLFFVSVLVKSRVHGEDNSNRAYYHWSPCILVFLCVIIASGWWRVGGRGGTSADGHVVGLSES